MASYMMGRGDMSFTTNLSRAVTRKHAKPEVPLDEYIERFYDRGDDLMQDNTAPIFRTVPGETPVLRRDHDHTILVIPGSFNPPHYGHLELIKHGLARGGADLNIIAAIIIPIDDTRLAMKFDGHRNPLLFSKHQRVQLFREDRNLPPNVWVFDRSERDWGTFLERTLSAIRVDGFNIQFMTLVGPDYVTMNGIHNPGRWGCEDTIVSDCCRPAHFASTYHDTPMTISRCDNWTHVAFDPVDVRVMLEAKAKQRNPYNAIAASKYTFLPRPCPAC